MPGHLPENIPETWGGEGWRDTPNHSSQHAEELAMSTSCETVTSQSRLTHMDFGIIGFYTSSVPWLVAESPGSAVPSGEGPGRPGLWLLSSMLRRLLAAWEPELSALPDLER